MSSGDLRVGVVGLGFGANHARVLAALPDVCLAALCDVDPQRLADAAHERDVATFSDLRAMLRETALDAVVVAVPPRWHASVALDVIAAGCALLVEKPLAPSLAEGEQIVEASAAAGVPLMEAHIERYNPAIAELTRRVRAGEAGRVLQVNARRLAYFVPRGRDVDVGVIHDLAYHDIYVMSDIVGAPVTRVFAETHARTLTPYEDALTGLLRFGDGGAIGSLEVNWLSPRKVRDLAVLGEHGLFVASYDDFRNASLEFQPAQSLLGNARPEQAEGAPVHLSGETPAGPVQLPLILDEPLRAELLAFTTAVRNGTPMPVSAADALSTLAVADALAESARTGQPVVPRTV